VNWEAASALAEWVGVVVVVVSLVYVAAQIRQNTLTVRSATELEGSRQWSEFHARIAHSPDMADIWDKGLTNPVNLSPSEKRKFIWFVAEYFALAEGLFRQRELGFLGDESWATHEKALAGLLGNPLLRSWWNSGVSPASPEFREAIEKAIEELGEQVWAYTPLSEL
jgi:hypothetical protein